MEPLADQSIFVLGSISGVVREALIAACLTALMILIFLGNWRSTLIIATSIPLAILTSIIVLSAIGQTINIMTLGGLALAVGVLVDEATVEIENIHTHLGTGMSKARAVLDACLAHVDDGSRTDVSDRSRMSPIGEDDVAGDFIAAVPKRNRIHTAVVLEERRQMNVSTRSATWGRSASSGDRGI